MFHASFAVWSRHVRLWAELHNEGVVGRQRRSFLGHNVLQSLHRYEFRALAFLLRGEREYKKERG